MRLYIAALPHVLQAPWQDYLPLLTPARAARAQRLRAEGARARCIAAGLLLRAVFGPDEPLETPLGKPYFPGKAPFSLSHSGGYAVLAVGGTSVGADVEQRRPADLRLARRFFHPDEYAFLCASPNQDMDFTRIWTCKESFLKALGAGLSIRPSSFRLPAPGTPLVYGRQPWYFRELELPGYALTLCDLEATPEPEIVDCAALSGDLGTLSPGGLA